MPTDSMLPDPTSRCVTFVDDIVNALPLSATVLSEIRADFLAHLETDVMLRQKRGVPTDQAVDEAIRAFGSAEAIRAQLVDLGTRRLRFSVISELSSSHRWPARKRDHGFEFFRSVAGDFRQGLRSFRRSPTFAATAILTLALGVGANAAVFAVVNGVLLRPLPYSDQEELVAIWPEKVFSPEMLQSMERDTSSFVAVTAYRQYVFALTGLGEATLTQGLAVGPRHFDVLRVRPILGRTFTDEDSRAGNEGVAIISHSFWQRHLGGNPDVIGRLIDVGGLGMTRRRIIGVLPASHAPIVGSPEIWVPIAFDPQSGAFLGTYGWRALGRLAPGVSIEEAIVDVRRLVEPYAARFPPQFRAARLSPVDVVPLVDVLVAGVRGTLWLLLGSVGFVLLIACVNVANLLFARATSRRHELAVRVALGAARSRLVQQMVTENVVLGLAGGLVGLVMAFATLQIARNNLQAYLPRAVGTGVEPIVFVFTVIVSVVASALFGIMPALQSVRVVPRQMLRDGDRGSTLGRRRWSQVLVAVEVALALVLVSSAALLLKSFWTLNGVNPGFDPRRIASAGVLLEATGYAQPAARRTLYEAVAARAAELPGVESVGAVDLMPMTSANRGIPYLVEGQTPGPGQSQITNIREVTPSYFRTIGLRLLSGRALNDRDVEGSPYVAVVNRTFERLHWPDGTAIGKQILTSQGAPLFEIVGVVADMHQHDLARAPDPELYLPMAQGTWSVGAILVRTRDDAAAIVAPLRGLIRSLNSNVPITSVQTMDQLVGASTNKPRFIMALFGGFALLALCLGLVGVYGVVSYAVGMRRREMGVRVALGATPEGVRWIVMRQALVPVIAGLALGFGLSLWVARSLGSLLFQVVPTDAGVHATVVLLLLAAGAMASWLPARRASRVDPVVVLTSD